MAQVVHYSAHGSSGLVFDCYMDELRAHLNSNRRRPRGGEGGAAMRISEHLYLVCQHCGQRIEVPLRACDPDVIECRSDGWHEVKFTAMPVREALR